MKRRRRSHRRGKNHTVRNIVISCFVITLFLATGYSAFQTVISINAKGNVKKYKVNFDPNGGYIDNNYKYVGTKYGDLPTPTREGYTFKGWNGKNLFNKDDIYYSSKTIFNSNTIELDASSIDGNVAGSLIISKIIDFRWLTDTISYSNNLNIGRKEHIILVDNTYNNFRFRLNTNKGDPTFVPNLILTNNKNYVISYNLDFVEINSAKATISNFQVEEGTIATEYEPYFITQNTKVVQKYEHTLIAIWEKNV